MGNRDVRTLDGMVEPLELLARTARDMVVALASDAPVESLAIYLLDASDERAWRSACVPEPDGFTPPDVGIEIDGSVFGDVLRHGGPARIRGRGRTDGSTTIVVPMTAYGRPSAS